MVAKNKHHLLVVSKVQLEQVEHVKQLKTYQREWSVPLKLLATT